MAARIGADGLQFEPSERPSPLTGLGLAAQGALVGLPPMVIFPMLSVQAAGGSGDLASWLVFISLAATGAAFLFQTMRLGIVGSGCHLAACPAAVAIPFCALALVEGGPKTLAALVFFLGDLQLCDHLASVPAAANLLPDGDRRIQHTAGHNHSIRNSRGNGRPARR